MENIGNIKNKLPENLSGVHIHFVGIKGTGMAALVEILYHNGAIITGSDVEERFYTDEILESLGINCGDLTTEGFPSVIDIAISPKFYSSAYAIFTNDYTKNEHYYSGYYENFTVLDSISGIVIYYYNENMQNVSASDTVVELVNRSTPMVWGEMPIAVFKVNGEFLYLLDRGDNKELLDSLEISKRRVVSNDDDRKYKVDFHVGEYID